MIRLFSIFIVPLLLTACNMGFFMGVTGENVEDRTSSMIVTLPAPATVANLSKYSLILIADPHFGAAKSQKTENFLTWFKAQMETADEEHKPRFIINIGDTMDGGHLSEANEYNALVAMLAGIAKENGLQEFPTYSVAGNHDLYNYGWDTWKTNIYPYTSYYRFMTKNFSWYFLDTANGTLGNDQLTDLEQNLLLDKNPKIVVSHYAVYCGGLFEYCIHNTIERNRLISAFARNNVKQVFEGHDHQEHDWTCENFREHAVTSFLYGYKFCLATIDEDAGTVVYQEISID